MATVALEAAYQRLRGTLTQAQKRRRHSVRPALAQGIRDFFAQLLAEPRTRAEFHRRANWLAKERGRYVDLQHQFLQLLEAFRSSWIDLASHAHVAGPFELLPSDTPNRVETIQTNLVQYDRMLRTVRHGSTVGLSEDQSEAIVGCLTGLLAEGNRLVTEGRAIGADGCLVLSLALQAIETGGADGDWIDAIDCHCLNRSPHADAALAAVDLLMEFYRQLPDAPKHVEERRAPDTKSDTRKKRKRLPMTATAAECIRRFKQERRRDPSVRMGQVVDVYAEETSASASYIKRVLSDNPDQWRG